MKKTRVLLKPELTRASVAHNLAIKLYVQGREAEQSERGNDLEESLRWFQDAVDLTPPHHPSKCLRLFNLTKCCIEKATTRDWEESGNGLDSTLTAYQELLYLLPPKKYRAPRNLFRHSFSERNHLGEMPRTRKAL
jgi:hypothetical protein